MVRAYYIYYISHADIFPLTQVAGIVGAGGPTGAVSFGLIFRALPEDPNKAFRIMGGIVLASGVVSALITIKGHRGLLFGKDRELPTIQVPAYDEEAAAAKGEEEGGDLELAEEKPAQEKETEKDTEIDEGSWKKVGTGPVKIEETSSEDKAPATTSAILKDNQYKVLAGTK